MPQFWVWMHYCHPTSHWTVYSASLFLPENMKLLHILIQLMWIQSSQEWNPEIWAHHQQELQTEAEQWELWGRTFNFKYIKNHWQAEPTERAPQTKCFSFCCSWSMIQDQWVLCYTSVFTHICTASIMTCCCNHFIMKLRLHYFCCCRMRLRFPHGTHILNWKERLLKYNL